MGSVDQPVVEKRGGGYGRDRVSPRRSHHDSRREGQREDRREGQREDRRKDNRRVMYERSVSREGRDRSQNDRRNQYRYKDHHSDRRRSRSRERVSRGDRAREHDVPWNKSNGYRNRGYNGKASFFDHNRRSYRERGSPSPHAGRREIAAQPRRRRSVSSSSSSSSSSGRPEEEDLTEAQLMEKLMGLSNFDTSKGKDHTANEISGVNKKTKRRYRQYMNRRGGFNRPLSPVF